MCVSSSVLTDKHTPSSLLPLCHYTSWHQVPALSFHLTLCYKSILACPLTAWTTEKDLLRRELSDFVGFFLTAMVLVHPSRNLSRHLRALGRACTIWGGQVAIPPWFGDREGPYRVATAARCTSSPSGLWGTSASPRAHWG